ncbi:hypothetical protein F4811DRAFT_107257 [Daldinia bambusicola]|nr:hypothetical protein F4811DRAFT_107257 [Daldinia bambusicola]
MCSYFDLCRPVVICLALLYLSYLTFPFICLYLIYFTPTPIILHVRHTTQVAHCYPITSPFHYRLHHILSRILPFCPYTTITIITIVSPLIRHPSNHILSSSCPFFGVLIHREAEMLAVLLSHSSLLPTNTYLISRPVAQNN